MLPIRKLSKILIPERIVVLETGHKQQALEAMIELLSGAEEVKDREELARGIFHREELMSTGIGQELGIPHVRIDSVKNIVLAMGVSREPIQDYTALDGEPVRLVFMIAAAPNQHADHIRLLSSISFRFKDAALRKAVLNAADATGVYQLIMKA